MQMETIRLAEASDWKGLQRLIESCPRLAEEQDEYGMLPLHWACTDSNVPLSLLDTLLSVYPEGAQKMNHANLLPLHIAIRGHIKTKLLRSLINAYPESLNIKTPNGATALDLGKEVGLSQDALRVLQFPRDKSLNQLNATMELETPENDDMQSVKSNSSIDNDRDFINSYDSWSAVPNSNKTVRDTQIKKKINNNIEHTPVFGSPSELSYINSMVSSQDPLLSPASSDTSTQSNLSNSHSVASAPPASLNDSAVENQDLHQTIFKRKHSFDPPTQLTAAHVAAYQHQKAQVQQMGNKQWKPMQSYPPRQGRHQSLPVIPSFENKKSIHPFAYKDFGKASQYNVNESNGEGNSFSNARNVGNGDVDFQPFESPPEWKRDDECAICRASFSMFKHRHHCRNCGKSICSQHSADKKIAMYAKGFRTPQRVCVTCYAMISHSRSTVLEQRRGSTPEIYSSRNALHSHNTSLRTSPYIYSANVKDSSKLDGQDGETQPRRHPPVIVSQRSNSPMRVAVHSMSAAQSTHNNSITGGSNNVATPTSHSNGPSSTGTLKESFETPPTGTTSNIQANSPLENISKNQDQRNLDVVMLQARVSELQHMITAQQKQIGQLNRTNLQLQQTILEQDEQKAETMQLINQLMSRVSNLELTRQSEGCGI